MVQTCSASTARCLVFIVNAILFTFAFLLLIGTVALLLTDVTSDTNLNDLKHGSLKGLHVPRMAAVLPCLLVVLLLIAASCGCCGACRENRACLGVYIVFLVAVLALELIAAGLLMFQSGQFEDTLRSKLATDVITMARLNWTQGTSEQQSFSQALYGIQFRMECCAVNNYTDYFHNSIYQNDTDKEGSGSGVCSAVPLTCCQHKSNMSGQSWQKPNLINQGECCSRTAINAKAVYPQGCYEKFHDTIAVGLKILALACFGFAVFQVIVLVAAVGLYCAIAENRAGYMML